MKFPTWKPAVIPEFKKENFPCEALYNWLDPHLSYTNMAYADFDMP